MKTVRTLVTALLLITSPAFADDAVSRVVIVPANGPWFINVSPDGNANVWLRTDPNIKATLPPDSFDFDALVTALKRLQTDEKPESPTHAGFLMEGADNADGFFLTDDTLIRYLVASFADEWQGNDLFRKALRDQPMFPEGA